MYLVFFPTEKNGSQLLGVKNTPQNLKRHSLMFLNYFLPGGAFSCRTETLYCSASIAKTYPSSQPMYISEAAVQQWAVGCTEVLIQFLGFSMKINKFNQQLTNICISCYTNFKIRKKNHYFIQSDIMFNISIILVSHPFTEASNLKKNILQKCVC